MENPLRKDLDFKESKMNKEFRKDNLESSAFISKIYFIIRFIVFVLLIIIWTFY
jgi:hypothetical protein